MSPRVLAWAPSNIAWVKYMGKTDSKLNLPANPSLSMTLDRLRTWVEVEMHSGDDRWVQEMPQEIPAGHSSYSARSGGDRDDWTRVSQPIVPALGESGIQKVLAHLKRVRALAPTALARAGVPLPESGRAEGMLLRTANTFPAASGIASSASAFAAMTLAVSAAICRDSRDLITALDFNADPTRALELRTALSEISRQGSGSSCRSLLGPYVLWDSSNVSRVECSQERSTGQAMEAMADLVLVVSADSKQVSSSQAHERVTRSPLWSGRPERARSRIERVSSALGKGDRATLAREVWSESWEMHSLFHTSEEPFTYWKPATLAILEQLSPIVQGRVPGPGAGAPLVTLDAGPNVHLIVPQNEVVSWMAWIHADLMDRVPGLSVLIDRAGQGGGVC